MKHVLILQELNKKDTCQKGVVLILRNDYFPFLHKREQVKHVKKGTGYEGLVPFKRRDAQMKSGRNGRRLPNHLSLGVEDMGMRRLVSCQEPIIERESAFDLFFDIVWEVIEEVYAGGMFYFIDR